MNKTDKPSTSSLRDRAEKVRANTTDNLSDDLQSITPDQAKKLLHELRVHQIELEMQNEELRSAQADLEAMRARYFDLYDLAPVGYLTLNGKGMIQEANLTAATMLGTTRSELVRQPLSQFIHKDFQDLFYRLLRRLEIALAGTGAEELQPSSFDLCMVKKDGTHFWAGLEASVGRNDDGSPLFRITLNDITERKRTEEALRNTQKLESLGVLAGGIAHDFNNLMGGIFGYIDLARETSTDNRSTAYLEKAMSTLERARGLTHQLLTFASGGAPVKQVERIDAFIQDTARFACSGSNVSCTFTIADDLWPCAIDKNQIGQVIDNIVINAQQAMPIGGTIDVSAKNVRFGPDAHRTLPNGNYVQLKVKDSGIGIPAKILPRIFDPFFTTKAKGHGLGLSTCHSIITRHDGAIDVQSEPGKGSTFTVYIPAATDAVTSAPHEGPSDFKGKGRVLVMDDEAVIRDILSSMLISLGFEVVCRKNGHDTCGYFRDELLANRAFAAMVLDLTIPGGMGGKEAIVKIRALNKDVPVFVASGYADDPVMANPTEYGFTASICKPFNKAELVRVLAKYL